MTIRQALLQAVHKQDIDGVEAIVAKDKKAIRYLMGMIYDPNKEKLEMASLGIARAAKHHPEFVKKMLDRLLWAMDANSGTNALVVPVVLKAIANERPELLVPIVPDLGRIAATDTSLHDGIYDTVRIVIERCPGKVGQKLAREVDKRIKKGKHCADGSV